MLLDGVSAQKEKKARRGSSRCIMLTERCTVASFTTMDIALDIPPTQERTRSTYLNSDRCHEVFSDVQTAAIMDELREATSIHVLQHHVDASILQTCADHMLNACRGSETPKSKTICQQYHFDRVTFTRQHRKTGIFATY